MNAVINNAVADGANNKSDVQLSIPKEQAIVLFDLLTRFSESNQLFTKDRSEEASLEFLLCDLAVELTEPFDTDYAKVLSLAKDKITGRCVAR